MKASRVFLVLMGMVVGNFALAATLPTASSLVGSYTGEDQLRRSCSVEVTQNGSKLDFKVTDYRNTILEFNSVRISNIDREINTEAGSAATHAVLYRNFGLPSFFGTYPETHGLTIQWHDGAVSSVWINVDKNSGPYVQNYGISCFGLELVK